MAGRKADAKPRTRQRKQGDIAMARDVGFDAHLPKPVEFSELEKLIVLMHENKHATGGEGET